MKKIYIEFTTPKGFNPFSFGVKFVQKTKYSHVRFRFDDTVFEAAQGSVHFTNEVEQRAKTLIIESYEVKLTGQEYNRFLEVCNAFNGTPYGSFQIIGFLYANLFGLRKNPLGDKSKTQICSEIVYKVMNEVKGLKMSRNIDLIGPKEVNKALFDSPQIAMKLEM